MNGNNGSEAPETPEVPKAPKNNNGRRKKRKKKQLCNMTQIAKKLVVSRDLVRAMRDDGAPFYRGKSRAKWVRKWVKKEAWERGRLRAQQNRNLPNREKLK
jgi:hypothetical protein